MPIQWNGPQVMNIIRQATMRGIVRGTENVRNEAIRLILETPKTGRIYRRGGVTHQASAPGEPPASDTGALISQIETTYNVQQLTGRVNFAAAHAPYLEYGTTKMAPRPFARPAAANKLPEVAGLIADELKRVLS